MSSQPPILEFETLIASTLSQTYLHDQDRIELEMELKQHLYDHYHDLVGKGMMHGQAVGQAIGQFGDFKKIRKQINRNYPNTLRETILKELIIGSILTLSVIIGPTLLIHRYSLSSLLTVLPIPFLALLIAIPFHHLVLKRQKSWEIPMFATMAIYLYVMGSQVYHSGLSLSVLMNQMLKIDISTFVNGSSGLFTLHTIHLIWILIIFLQFVKDDSKNKAWEKMIFASFQYWGMIGLGIAISLSIPSSAPQLVFINVFLITAMLEQVLLNRVMTTISNRFIKHFNFSIR